MAVIKPEQFLDPEILGSFANPIQLLTTNPPTEEAINTAAVQLATYGTRTQPPGAETGEDGIVPDPFRDQVIPASYRVPDAPASTAANPDNTEPIHPPNTGTGDPREDTPSSGRPSLGGTLDGTDIANIAPATGVNEALISSCAARPQGSMGTPSDGYDYQDGPVGEGGSAGGDYSVPGAGKMTDADWANMQYVSKANFENPGMMDRATVDAMDRASACNGGRIKWTEDGAATGHVSKSQHHGGNAFDVSLAGLDTAGKQKVLDCAFNAGFSGFGFYTNSPNMLHIDTRDSGNTWYWGNKAGNVPDWARPVWEKNGGTKSVVGMKPFHGKGRGYQGTGGAGDEGAGAGADLTPKGETGPTTGIGSGPLNPPHKQGDRARSSDRDYIVEVVARTVYGEAAGQPAAGKAGVAAVIRNRAMSGQVFGGRTSSNMADMCLAPGQFECWKRPSKMNGATTGNSDFAECVKFAAQAVDGTISDPTGGAKWFQSGTRYKDSWVNSHKFTVRIGGTGGDTTGNKKGHRFYA